MFGKHWRPLRQQKQAVGKASVTIGFCFFPSRVVSQFCLPVHSVCRFYHDFTTAFVLWIADYKRRHTWDCLTKMCNSNMHVLHILRLPSYELGCWCLLCSCEIAFLDLNATQVMLAPCCFLCFSLRYLRKYVHVLEYDLESWSHMFVVIHRYHINNGSCR